MEVGHQQQIPVSIEDEIKKSYLDYAMSVIIGRALPDVRDGLKPVHRRVLFAMRELKNEWNKPYKKSARVVGDVIGKYHPHGDAAVYDALVRLAQDFSMRYPLVDGQGNFGSVDGDSPAAMRYTEVRMAKLVHEFMEDLEKETVDFEANYDSTLEEPTVLPSRVPDLLINGSSGIAVGMATNIPPHNLGEVIDAILAVIENPQIKLDGLMKLLPGPDFPTAGFIYGTKGIRDAYATGRGSIKARARSVIETLPRKNLTQIVITEIPYQVNKARLIEKIVELVKEKRIEGIVDIRDESDREGMRIVLVLRKDANPHVILNQLYKFTQMQIAFGVILLAIVNRRPEVLTLKEIIEHFIDHRKEVIFRRTRFELRQAEERAHILEGLKIALDHLDEVIALIRSSSTVQEARTGLMEHFGLSERQSTAILEMRLQRLTGMERDKIEQEYNELLKQIEYFRSVLNSERLVLKIASDELCEIRKNYSDERRTEIIPDTEELEVEDLIAEEDMIVTISNRGYIKRNALSIYRAQRRGGRGKTGMETLSEDFVEHLFMGSTHDTFLFFTNLGRAYWLKVHEIPQAGRVAKGKALVNLLALQPGESIATVLNVGSFEEDRYIIIATRRGLVKKTPLSAYANRRANGIIAIEIDENDELIAARVTNGSQHVLLASKKGKCVRFREQEARSMGRVAKGVIGMRLDEGDDVVALQVLDEHGSETILTVTENGYGKRTPNESYRVQGRGGKGIIDIRTTARNGDVIGMSIVSDQDDIMLITNRGIAIRFEVREISIIGRATQGVRLKTVEPGEKVVGIAKLAEKEED
ncbi:MAG: DNA gyrase subunit A [Deltaproteobacteria bacterium]|nr:DNA gyrase subunit A [Deltaproteobacteria bacterium]